MVNKRTAYFRYIRIVNIEGEPFYHSLRYSYTFEDRLQAGFVAEKDAGEPFGTHIIKDMTFIPHIYS